MKITYAPGVLEPEDPMDQVLMEGLVVPRWLRDAIHEAEEKR